MFRSARPRRIALLAAHSVAEADGIRDYTCRLSATLRARGLDARLLECGKGGRPPRMGAGAHRSRQPSSRTRTQ
jgi:hypothetical protein